MNSIPPTQKNIIPEINMLCETSIPNEYYFGNLPGTLQYKVTKDELANLDLSIDDEETRGFRLDFHTEDNYRRLLPNTNTANSNSWRILLVMRAERENNIVCFYTISHFKRRPLKGSAFLNVIWQLLLYNR